MNNIDKSMPPKKSKAARKTEVSDDEQDTKPATDEPVKHNGISDEAEGDKESLPDKNIFKQEIVEGKRKRSSPASEQALHEWLEKNLKEEEDSPDLLVSDLYKCYLEACTSAAAAALEEHVFKKMLQQTFPKGVALVENSPYNDIVRKKKKKKKTETKVKADSLQLKMKDIIKDAITALGNPRKGVSARVVKHWIAGKYPALQVDRRPTMIASALVRECNYGHIECVRGIGAVGVYRLLRTPEEEAEEVAAEKKAAEEKAKKKKDKLAPIGEGDEEGKSSEDGKAEGDKKEGGSEEEGDAKAEKDEKEEKEEKVEGEESGDKKKDEKKKKKRKSTKKKPKRVDYENPMRIEDAFELAFTYNCEPKEASGKKILKYLQDFYQETVPIEKFKKCIESGSDKGFWSQVTGPIGTGTVRLTIDEFDPTADDDLIGKIMNAIVACTEPKRSSAVLLKKYITDYHPDFKVDTMPKKYGHALQRAINNNKIVQLSGIGATGSFQLVEPFRPSPLVLQGKGTSEVSDDESVASGADLAVDQFLDAYKPRPSKRRGMGRTSATTIIVRLDPSVKTPRQGKVRPSGKSKSGGRNVKKAAPQYKDSDDEEEDEDEDEVVPAKKRKVAKAGRGRPKSTTAAKGKNSKKAKPAKKAKPTPSKRKASKSSEDEAEESKPEAAESDEDVVEYTPRKSTSRGGAAAKKTQAKSAKKKEKSESESEPEVEVETKKGKVSRVSARSGKRKLDESNDEEDEKPEYTPRKSTSRGGRGGAKVPAKKAKEDSSEEEAESEPEVVESKSRGGKKAAKSPAPKSAKAAKSSKKTPAKGKKGSQKEKEESSEESDVEEIPVSKKTPAKGKKGSQKEKEESSEESDVEEIPVSKKTPAKGKKGSQKEKEESSEESDVEEIPVSKPPAKGKKGSKKVTPPTPVKDDSTEESDLEEIPVSKKVPAKGKKGARKASPPPPVKDVSSDDSDMEEIPAPSSTRKSRSDADSYSVKVVKPQAGGKKSAKSTADAKSLSIVIEKRHVDKAESFQTKAAKKVAKKRKGKK